MSQADMALVRDHVPGGFNLAVGEPYFLQEVYGPFYPQAFNGRIQYPLLKGDTELVKLLESKFPGKHVVVTNGAKQALYAAIHALQVQRDGDETNPEDFLSVYHPAPYWPTYPTIADLSVLGFTTQPVKHSIKVLTAPNNPDGSMDDSGQFKWDIWDAAYADPIYGWDYIVPYHRISVWSGAKAYGVSSYRVGWLVTPEKDLADLASQYVEKTTSGVAQPSQDFMRRLILNLDSVSPEENARLIAKARELLLGTSKTFMELGEHFSEVRGVPATGQGMFAWVKAKDPDGFKELLGRAKVKVVSGKFCGASDDWFRVSMGVLPETMREAVEAIKNEHG